MCVCVILCMCECDDDCENECVKSRGLETVDDDWYIDLIIAGE